MSKQKIYSVLFDVLPVNRKTGDIEIQKIESVQQNLDLAQFRDPIYCDVVDLAFADHIVPIETTPPAVSEVKWNAHQQLEEALKKTTTPLNLNFSSSQKPRGTIPIRQSHKNKEVIKSKTDLPNGIWEIGRIETHASTHSFFPEPILANDRNTKSYLTGSIPLEAQFTDLNWQKSTDFLPLTGSTISNELEKKLKELREVKIEPIKKEGVIINLGPATEAIPVSPPIVEKVTVTKANLSEQDLLVCPPQVTKFQWGKLLTVGIIANILFIGGLNFFQKGIQIKNEVTKKGNNALASLERAKDAFLGFRFDDANHEFIFAEKNFQSAQQELNNFSSSFLGLITALPGLNKTKDAEQLSEAGKLISESGADIASAFDGLKNANILSSIIPGGSKKQSTIDMFSLLRTFRVALIGADRNVVRAGRLLADVDSSLIPEEKRETFIDFQNKIPEFSKFLNAAIDYSGVLMEAMGQNGPMRYLVLLQNTSELRPTGGFPGTYAVVEFDQGVMKSFFVDDIYNPDGQLKELIIPPKPLQKITPTWGMRDSAWWADFPTSAYKVYEFYKKERKEEIDGVIALNVDMILKLLKFVEPIKLSKYGTVINPENFLEEIQSEVEYGSNRIQPKTVLKDFAPLFLDSITHISEDKWADVFLSIVESIQQKDLMVYFLEPSLEKFVKESGLAGEIRDFDGDFLMINHTNVMGSKTDAVIDNKVTLKLNISQDVVEHELTVQRIHNGGDSKYGFFNKKNNDYMRVFVPKDAELISIDGNSDFSFNPLIDYSDGEFKEDPDLEDLESAQKDTNGIKEWEENGKKVFGFWLVLEPKTTKAVTIRYKTNTIKNGNLIDYSLLVQKQPGVKSNINISIDSDRDLSLTGRFPESLNAIGDTLVMDQVFEKDILVGASFK
ncbi:MAG: DUF4012 domain-containing protein [Parcubacteria group bacterium]|nr:DUF4012 domain-containing protein [Parcubacteria group bacterium]